MPRLWNQLRKHSNRRNAKNRRKLNQVRQIERLETRITPVVGPLAVPMPVPNGAFPGVVQITDSTGSCTGSLLSTGRHILTAAHCVDGEDTNGDGRADGNGMVDAGTFVVRFDMGTAASAAMPIPINVPSTSVRMVDNNWNDGGDIAIMTLPELAPLGATRFNWDRDGTGANGVFTIVGYGRTGTGNTGDTQAGGQKRTGNNWLEALGRDLDPFNDDHVLFDFDNCTDANDTLGDQLDIHRIGICDTSTNPFTPLESMGGRGDSGGPALVNGVIAGVYSMLSGFSGSDVVGGSNASFGDVGAYTMTSSWRDWINGIVDTSYDLVVDMQNQPAGRTAGADTIELKKVSNGDLQVLINGTLLQAVPAWRVNSIRVLGSGDADTLIVSSDIQKTIAFDGRGGVDRLTAKGNNFVNSQYIPGATGASGSLTGSVSWGQSQVNFQGFESTSTVTLQNMSTAKLYSPNAADSYTVASASNGLQVTGTSGGVPIAPLVTSHSPIVSIDAASHVLDTWAVDTINVQSVKAGTFLDIRTGVGNDVVTIGNNLDTVLGAVTYNGESGVNRLVLNDTVAANKAARFNRISYDLTDTQVVRTNQPYNPSTNQALPTVSGTIKHYNVGQFTLLGSNTGNTVRMNMSGNSLTTALHTGNLRDDIAIERAPGPLWVNAGGGDDFIDLQRADVAATIDAGAGADSINLSRSRFVLTDIAAPVIVNGQEGSDTVNANDSSRGGATSFRLAGNVLSDPSGAWTGSVSFDGTLENLILPTGHGDNFVDVQSVPAGTTARVYTLGGNDTIRLNAGMAGAVALDAGEGSDTLDYTGNTLAVAVDLAKRTATKVRGGAAGFENAIGGAGDDLLIGDRGRNVLRGGPGRDSIYGGMGNDTVDGGTANDTVVGDTVAYGIDKVLDIRLPSSQSFDWGGLKEKWLLDGANASYYITPSGELFKWDGASGPGFAVALRGQLTGSLSPVYYDEPSYLANAQPGTVEITAAAAATAKYLDNRYGFGPYQYTAADNSKWFQGSGDLWYYITVGGEVYPDIEDWRFPGPVGVVDPVYFSRVDLLTTAADGGAIVNAAFDLDRTQGLWSDGQFGQNSAGRNEKWVRDAAGAWYSIETNGVVLKNGSGTPAATLDAIYWADPAKLYNAYTSRQLATVTAAQGYPDHDIVLGTDGDDVLVGGAGRNLLIGGRGADVLHGESDEDILIAGYTEYDGTAVNFQALDSIMARWTDSSRTFDQRVGDLTSTNNGINPWVLVPFVPFSPKHDWLGEEGGGTVHKDAEIDRLTGYAGRDWFFAASNDVLVDLLAGDRLDWTVN